MKELFIYGAPMMPLWLNIKKTINKPIKISSYIFIATPVFSKLSIIIQSYFIENASFELLINILDIEQIQIPPNMLKCFWSGVLLCFCNIIFNFSCPSIISNYQNKNDWLDHSKKSTELKKTLGIEQVKTKYDEIFICENNSKPAIRLLIACIYFFAIYLILLVIVNQLVDVFIMTKISELLTL